MSDQGEVITIDNEKQVNTSIYRDRLLTVLKQAFTALDPEHLVAECTEKLLSGKSKYGHVHVIGFGKASLKMYEGIRNITSGISSYSAIIIPEGQEAATKYPELELLRGNHPIPAQDTLTSSRKMMNGLSTLNEDDLVLVLVSGGGSALFEIPEEIFSIDSIAETAKCLMNSGADIHELNAVRQAMSSVKGGKLAKRLYPAEVHAFIISDVPGDDPSVIASGPLTKPSYSPDFFKKVLEKYSDSCDLDGVAKIPDRSNIVEARFFQKVTTRLILKNRDFVDMIGTHIGDPGEKVVTLPEPITGDVVETAEWFADRMRKEYRKSGNPIWIIGGGETTAKVVGKGKGGRNCELALRVALNMEKDENYLFASLGTDGIDGVSPAMGGISDTSLVNTVTREEIQNSLNFSDSYNLLNKYNSAIITGYTGTNVSDIFVAYYGGKNEG